MTGEKAQIKVLEICGQNCAGLQRGEVLSGKLAPALASKSDVILDFTGLKTVTSSFLNVAIGRFFGGPEGAAVESQINWVGIDEDTKAIIQIVIDNAKQFFRNDKDQQETHDDIASRSIEESS